jgi:hypothetical protein
MIEGDLRQMEPERTHDFGGARLDRGTVPPWNGSLPAKEGAVLSSV